MKSSTAVSRPRRRYKDLWTQEQARARRIRDEREELRGELRRIRAVLADYAVKELVPDLNQAVEMTPAGQPISLYPIGIEGLKAFMMSQSKMQPDDVGVVSGFDNFEWRGRKLICRP